MQKHRVLSLSLILLATATAASVAGAQEVSTTQDVPLTREQVLAELHAAQAAGLVPHGDLDITAHNGGPDDAPARTAISTATRAQVKAELLQAIKTGSITVGDDSRTLAEEFPERYAAARAEETREQQARHATARAAAQAASAAVAQVATR